MPTYTATYNLGKPVVGADEDAWGDTLNASLDSLDGILDGTTPVTGIDINSGTLDGVTIGGTTAGAGTFTTLTATTSITGTLATAAQPNITSVGSLTSLDVGGTITADGLTVDGTTILSGNVGINIGTPNANLEINSATGSTFRLSRSDGSIVTDDLIGAIEFHQNDPSGEGAGVVSKIESINQSSFTGFGGLIFSTGQSASLSKSLQISATGDISFYEDTGTTAKFFWDASAESLTIGYSQEPGVNGSELNLVGSSTTNNTAQAALAFFDGGTNDLATIRSYRGANFSSADLAFEVAQGGAAPAEAMRIDSSGNVIIGDTSQIGSAVLGVSVDTASENGFSFKTSTDGAFGALRALNNAGAEKLNIQYDTTNAFMAFRTANTERMRIDSGGRVGIGTTSPSSYNPSFDDLVIAGPSNQGITIATPSTSLGQIAFADGTTGDQQYRGLLRYEHAVDAFSIFTAGLNERMRIDSSGNLLVGKTTTGATTAGMAWISNEYLQLANTETGAGDRALLINRQSADGTLVEFRKANSTVGSIESRNGTHITVQSGGAGTLKSDTTEVARWLSTHGFYPVTNNTFSLGTSALNWKDLYLSGGVYLGGTGAANKLDDYEEGTWTPTYADASNNTISTVIDGGYASYTKVGRIVTVHARINTSGLTSLSGFSGELRITGLPFTSGSNRRTAFGTLTASRNFSSYGSLKAVPWNISIFNGANYIRIHKYVSSATESAYTYPELDVTDLTLLGGNRNRLEFSITYEAT